MSSVHVWRLPAKNGFGLMLTVLGVFRLLDLHRYGSGWAFVETFSTGCCVMFIMINRASGVSSSSYCTEDHVERRLTKNARNMVER